MCHERERRAIWAERERVGGEWFWGAPTGRIIKIGLSSWPEAK
jgi:hypothetical protein